MASPAAAAAAPSAAAPAAATPSAAAPVLLDAPKAAKALVAASSAGSAAALRELLDECLLVDHTAVHVDNCKPVPVDLVDEEGISGLVAACDGGHVECVELLLLRGALAAKPTSKGITPVMAACFRGHTECLRLLLRAGASAYIGVMTDKQGNRRTPIVLAIERMSTAGEDKCMRMLLSHDQRLHAGASVQERADAAPYYAEALVTSCSSARGACVELLLGAKVDPNVAACGTSAAGLEMRVSPLQAATAVGDVTCVRALLRAGAIVPEAAPLTGAAARQVAAERAAKSAPHAEIHDLLEACAAARALIGQRVRLTQLQTRSQLNDQIGVVDGYDCQRERLIVRMVSGRGRSRSEDLLLLKAINLVALGDAHLLEGAERQRQRTVAWRWGTATAALVAVSIAVFIRVFPAAMPTAAISESEPSEA